MTTTATTPRGGEWLIEDAAADSVFTREQLSEEHRLISQAADEFMDGEVRPALEKMEQKDWALARALVQRGGELGLLGTEVPEEYGGVGLDKVASVLVGESIGKVASFATTFGAQTGLAITPLLCFGTEAQKQQYLPALVSGATIGAYALSESGSGSDALSAKTKATRQPDGSFRLTGEKMWITNGGFADFFIVFAKVDGTEFTAFLVERAFPGVSSGKEEHKMGLHGSSTTPLILQDAQVPAGNVLGEIGKGHKVAFNVLNYGRFKLAAMSSGGAKAVIAEAAKYAAQRKQFGQPIASFGAIRHKLAEMTIREYAVESMLDRTAGLIDGFEEGNISQLPIPNSQLPTLNSQLPTPESQLTTANSQTDSSKVPPVLAALEEFAIEASILKVAGSEMIDYVVDENVQIHGGNGFVRDYPAERSYRDARVNRIFEGTNEINRLLIPGMLVRRALKGGLPLIAAAKKLQDDILSPSMPEPVGDAPLEAERRVVSAMKKVALMVLGTAMQTYGTKLTDEQEVLTAAADIIIDVFAAESVLLRAERSFRVNANDTRGVRLQAEVAETFISDAAGRVELAARTALAAMADGDTLRTLLAALRRILKVTPVNTVARRRAIADAVLERKGYPF